MEVPHHRSFDIRNIYNYKYVSEPWLYKRLLDVRNYFETIYKIWISYKQANMIVSEILYLREYKMHKKSRKVLHKEPYL